MKIGTALTLDFKTKYGPISRWVEQAYTLYFDWLNTNRGGVDIGGEKHWVQLVLLDDQSDKTRTKAITEYLVNEQKVIGRQALSATDASKDTMLKDMGTPSVRHVGRARTRTSWPKINARFVLKVDTHSPRVLKIAVTAPKESLPIQPEVRNVQSIHKEVSVFQTV